MPFKDEICKIVIENIELLEEAPKVIDTVEEKIFKAINERFKLFFMGKEGWKNDGEYDYLGEEGIIFSAEDWPVNEDKSYPVYYLFGESEELDSWHPLTVLLGKVPEVTYAIYFNADHKDFGMNARKWKTFLVEKYQQEPTLQELGVIYDNDGCLGIPVVLNMQAVADEYPDFDECLKPVDTAIKILMQAHPYIDKIVQELTKTNACE